LRRSACALAHLHTSVFSAIANPLSSGEYRLYSRKADPKTGKRRNLGTFKSRAAAEKHERAVQYFKRTDSRVRSTIRAVHAIAGVAQARQDIAVVVQLLIDRRRPDRDVRMLRLEMRDTLGGCKQADKARIARAARLQQRSRGAG